MNNLIQFSNSNFTILFRILVFLNVNQPIKNQKNLQKSLFDPQKGHNLDNFKFGSLGSIGSIGSILFSYKSLRLKNKKCKDVLKFVYTFLHL